MIDLAPCLEILALLPPEFETLDVIACTDEPAAFARARLELFVPAPDVVFWAERLTEKYNMGPMQFICCGYEPARGLTGSIAIPDGVIAAGAPSTFPALSVSMTANGISTGVDGGDVLALGDEPAIIYLTLWDV